MSGERGAEPVLRTVALRKTYRSRSGPVEALHGISVEVRTGELFGILGPNGAGKSTTIGILTTLVRPSGGSASVAGIDVVRDPVRVRARIGVVSQAGNLDRELNVLENLVFRGRYFGLTASAARRRAAELLERGGLAHRSRAMVTELSGGQARRVAIARALMHRPEVLFLDEPTAGVDPQTRISLWQTVREYQRDGLTVLLTTHHLAEAEQLCDRVAIIDHGRVLACDTVSALTTRTGGDTVLTVRYDGPAQDLTLPELPPGVRKTEVDGDRIRVFAAHTDGLLGGLITAGAARGLGVRDVTTVTPSLESAYLALTGKEYAG
ncbi:ABC transporter ATP-binding protein [Crossiella sp. SN42]|uniref:ABC transporter ATP-binding protein n=1 Tax=Crossiella sp. SN42 TaxID=2944808 RepID=UPI00207C7452|nr:ATP-binding cassette domain-containing protein [Crossiella sp. SN42]MCO1580317.1 ABC transporter ATP-binding protein [Crossiella sp. SN42]